MIIRKEGSSIRIGGDFEITPNLLVGKPINNLNDWILDRDVVWTDTGRSAIYLALQELLQKGIEKVAYLPVYCCESVKQPFFQLGFEIKYYSMGEDLQHPNYLPDDLNNKVLLFINYFGFENSCIYSWLKKMNELQNFYIIEDCVQAAFNNFNHSLSDYSIYSFRKFTAQPDGAALIAKSSLLNLELETNFDNEEFLSKQIFGKVLRAAVEDEKVYLNLLKESEALLDTYIIPNQISEISKFIMKRININELKQKRRKNWNNLYHELKLSDLLKTNIKSLYDSIGNNTVPLGFPIVVKKELRDELLLFLREQNIFCPVHWRINSSYFEEDYELSNKIITLPIDQRMNDGEIKYIIENLINFYEVH
ncbi:hypothetical protein [Lysinibacillus xylanilyticus]|uniref:hypothetical protein n=1 Tax=Lysinibacillus xylanilyticus TaxID=582475 RepID=UPI00083C96C4|nr:hypothetical protein [Lysinibacillus xylanilyticus]